MIIRTTIKCTTENKHEYTNYSSSDKSTYWYGELLPTKNGYTILKHTMGGNCSLGASSFTEEQKLFVVWSSNNKTMFQIKELRDNELRFTDTTNQLYLDMVTRNNIKNGVRFTKPYVLDDGGEWALFAYGMMKECIEEPSTSKAQQNFADHLEFLTFEIHQPKMDWSKIKLMNISQRNGKKAFYSYEDEKQIKLDLDKKSRERLSAI